MAFDPSNSPFVSSLRRLDGIAPTPMAFVPIEDDPVNLRGASRQQVAYYAWLRTLFRNQHDHYGISEGYVRLLASEILTGNTFDRPSIVATLIELLGWAGRANLTNVSEFVRLPLIANARTGSKTTPGKVAFKTWRTFGVNPHRDLVWNGVSLTFRTLTYKHTRITELLPAPGEGWPLEVNDVGNEQWRAALHEQVLDVLDRAYLTSGGFFRAAENDVEEFDITYRDAFAGFVDHDPGLHGVLARVPAYTSTPWFEQTLQDALLLAEHMTRNLLNGEVSIGFSPHEPTVGFRSRLEPHLSRWLDKNPPPGWREARSIIELGVDDEGGLPIDPDEDDLDAIFGVGSSRAFGLHRRPTNKQIVRAHEKLLHEKPTTSTRVFHPPANYYIGAKHVLDLDQGRLQTYLAWREGFRRGEAPKTDLELLTVYMVELVNLLGFEDAEDAYQTLKLLITSYYEAIPNAHATFYAWLLEYAIAFPTSDTPDDAAYYLHTLHAKKTGRVAQGMLDPSIIVSWNQDREYEKLDKNLLLTLTGYDMHGAKYGREQADEALLLRVLQTAMKAADEHFEAHYRKTLAGFTLGTPKQRTWYRPLEGIPTLGPLEPGRGPSAFTPKRLRNYEALATNVLKYAENLARTKDKVRAKRNLAPSKPFTLELKDRIKQAVDPILNPPPPPIRISVNKDHLSRLESESASLRERLVHETTLQEEPAPTEPPLEPTPVNTPHAEAGEGGSAPFQQPAGAWVVGIEDEDYQDLLDALTPVEQSLLTHLATRDARGLEAVAKEVGKPLSLLVDELNEKALEFVGDTLVDAGGDAPELVEEHAEAFAPLMRTPAD